MTVIQRKGRRVDEAKMRLFLILAAKRRTDKKMNHLAEYVKPTPGEQLSVDSVEWWYHGDNLTGDKNTYF